MIVLGGSAKRHFLASMKTGEAGTICITEEGREGRGEGGLVEHAAS